MSKKKADNFVVILTFIFYILRSSLLWVYSVLFTLPGAIYCESLLYKKKGIWPGREREVGSLLSSGLGLLNPPVAKKNPHPPVDPLVDPPVDPPPL